MKMARHFCYAALLLIALLSSLALVWPSLAEIAYTYTSTPNVAIADYSTVYDHINVTMKGLPEAIIVSVAINHTYQGDLTVTLNHNDTTVALVDRKTSCPQYDHIFATFRDDAASPFQYTCATDGTFKPVGQFAAFNNKDMSGNWTLGVRDNYKSDQGSFLNWTLTIIPAGPKIRVNTTNVAMSQATSMGITIYGSSFSPDLTGNSVQLVQSVSAGSPTSNPVCQIAQFDTYHIVCTGLEGLHPGRLFATVTSGNMTSEGPVQVATIVPDQRPVVNTSYTIINDHSVELVIYGQFNASIPFEEYNIVLSGPAASHPTDDLFCFLSDQNSVQADSLRCTLSGTLLPGVLYARVHVYEESCALYSSSGAPQQIASVITAPIVDMSIIGTETLPTTAHRVTIYGTFDVNIQTSQYSVILGGSAAANGTTCAVQTVSYTHITCVNITGGLVPGNLTAIVVIYPNTPAELRSNGNEGVMVAEVVQAPVLDAFMDIIYPTSPKNLLIRGTFDTSRRATDYEVNFRISSYGIQDFPCFTYYVSETEILCRSSMTQLPEGVLTARIYFLGSNTPYSQIGRISRNFISKPLTVTPASGRISIGSTISIGPITSNYGQITVDRNDCVVNNNNFSTGQLDFFPVSPSNPNGTAASLYSYMLTYRTAADDASFDSTSSFKFNCALRDSFDNKVYITQKDIVSTTSISFSNAIPSVYQVYLSPMDGYAHIGSVIEVQFCSNGPLDLAKSSCQINTRPANLVMISNLDEEDYSDCYLASYVVAENDPDFPQGRLPFQCTIFNLGGNNITVDESVLPANTLRGDGHVPQIYDIWVYPAAGYAKVGTTIKVSFIADSILELASSDPNSCTINSRPVTELFATDSNQGLVYTVQANDPVWDRNQLPVVCTLREDSGNVVTLSIPPLSSLAGDPVPPTVTSISITPNTGIIGIGSEIKIRFTTSKPTSCANDGGKPTINGIRVDSIVSLSSHSDEFEVIYIVKAGDPSFPTGKLAFNCVMSDVAGNTVSVQLPNNTLSAITTVPALTSSVATVIHGASNSKPSLINVVRNGDSVVISITTNKIGGLSSPSCIINGVDVADTISTNNAGLYNFTYVHTSSSPAWAAGQLPVECKLADAAGNTLTVTKFTEGNSIEGLKNKSPGVSEKIPPEAKQIFGVTITLLLIFGAIGIVASVLVTFFVVRYFNSRSYLNKKVLKSVMEEQHPEFNPSVNGEDEIDKL
eukprot:GEZU01021843.1.p1 GENE.GEZU01021843.1~~GEZU01021843.1.p1  ORF type:complete len:1221 (-),score=357.19 GEZU01021843.1:65-3727(-)